MKMNWHWIKLVIYALVLILINGAATTLFFRIDLTKNKIHTLSKTSIETVAGLEEPLTIKAFFSETLPSPYNNLEQEIRDLLESYSLRANKFFNYSILKIGAEGNDESQSSKDNRSEARNYGIYPIQIQKVESDEIKLVNAFMGMVFIQGDLIETIPVISTDQNRSLTVTSTIQKMSSKTGAILALDEDIKIKLYLSSTLANINESLASYSTNLDKAVDNLSRQYYDRIEYRSIDPDNLGLGDKAPEDYGLNSISLQSSSGEIEKVYASIIVEIGESYRRISLLTRNLFGGYEVEDPTVIAQSLPGSIDSLVGMNPKIGYVTDHNSVDISERPQGPNSIGFSNFYQLLSENYDLVPVSLMDEVPEDLVSLFVISPQAGFTDWELFQLDQYILKGHSVAFFIDSMNSIRPQSANQFDAPIYLPNNTGLEPLLEHYGLRVRRSYVLDENSYRQTNRGAQGNVMEIPIYNAPFIDEKTINDDSVVMSNIKRLIMLNISPLDVLEEPAAGTQIQVLFSSSETSWEMSENINISNPMMISTAPEDQRDSFDIAAIAQGDGLTSFFKGKPVPDVPQSDEGEQAVAQQESTAGLASFEADQVDANIQMIESGHGQVFVTGSSQLLKDNILDTNQSSPNTAYLLNLVDYLSGREDYARMRSKGQNFSPLQKTSPLAKRLVKGFNIAGLPVLVIMVGLIMWLRRISKSKEIEKLFSGEGQ